MAYDLPQVEKQPRDNRLYDVECLALLTIPNDTVSAVTDVVVAPTTLSPLTLGTPVPSGTRFQVRISGGLAGTRYKVTTLFTTTLGDTVEGEFEVLTLDS